MRIGVLALQGAFIEHEKVLERLDVEPVEMRLPQPRPRHRPGGHSLRQP